MLRNLSEFIKHYGITIALIVSICALVVSTFAVFVSVNEYLENPIITTELAQGNTNAYSMESRNFSVTICQTIYNPTNSRYDIRLPNTVDIIVNDSNNTYNHIGTLVRVDKHGTIIGNLGRDVIYPGELVYCKVGMLFLNDTGKGYENGTYQFNIYNKYERMSTTWLSRCIPKETIITHTTLKEWICPVGDIKC